MLTKFPNSSATTIRGISLGKLQTEAVAVCQQSMSRFAEFNAKLQMSGRQETKLTLARAPSDVPSQSWKAEIYWQSLV